MVIFNIFIYKNGKFGKISEAKFDSNIHQNAPNCTILNKFIGGGGVEGMPPNPLIKIYCETNEITLFLKKMFSKTSL